MPDTRVNNISENNFFFCFTGADNRFCFSLFLIYEVGNWAQAKIKFYIQSLIKIVFKTIRYL